mmetsp:Transcript_54642/g.122272  ORF Transcript_54642/g.122272 Transcript_54642/m.122272 type:complete len:207 (+) Transcript_54642:84-704(+)
MQNASSGGRRNEASSGSRLAPSSTPSAACRTARGVSTRRRSSGISNTTSAAPKWWAPRTTLRRKRSSWPPWTRTASWWIASRCAGYSPTSGPAHTRAARVSSTSRVRWRRSNASRSFSTIVAARRSPWARVIWLADVCSGSLSISPTRSRSASTWRGSGGRRWLMRGSKRHVSMRTRRSTSNVLTKCSKHTTARRGQKWKSQASPT